jgi:hypothetical protein
MPQPDHRHDGFLIDEIGHLTGIEMATPPTPPKNPQPVVYRRRREQPKIDV